MSRALAITIAAALVIVAAIAWAGRASEGQRALADADSALGRGDPIDAILAARMAASARCPGCLAPALGYAKLERIAEDAEAHGDDQVAFAAWRSYRAALLSTSFGRDETRRAHAELELARFAHRLDAAAVAAGAPPTAAATEDKLRVQFAESDVPSGAALGLVGLGGVVFLAMAARYVLRKRLFADLALAGLGIALAALGALAF